MSVKEFELFHGAALTKLVRADRSMTLRTIQTQPNAAWSSYRINDKITLVIKHSMRPTRLKRVRGGIRWHFVLSVDQIKQVRGKDRWLALVCGGPRISNNRMEICLLDPDDIVALIELRKRRAQGITVKYLPGKQLRVSSPLTDEYAVPRARLDKWDPGNS